MGNNLGAYHLARKSGNFRLKSTGEVIFRKFCTEIVEYLQMYSSFSVRNGTAEISLPFAKLSSFQSLICRKQLREIEVQMVSAISFGWFANFGKTLTITLFDAAKKNPGFPPTRWTSHDGPWRPGRKLHVYHISSSAYTWQTFTLKKNIFAFRPRDCFALVCIAGLFTSVRVQLKIKLYGTKSTHWAKFLTKTFLAYSGWARSTSGSQAFFLRS